MLCFSPSYCPSSGLMPQPSMGPILARSEYWNGRHLTMGMAARMTRTIDQGVGIGRWNHFRSCVASYSGLFHRPLEHGSYSSAPFNNHARHLRNFHGPFPREQIGPNLWRIPRNQGLGPRPPRSFRLVHGHNVTGPLALQRKLGTPLGTTN